MVAFSIERLIAIYFPLKCREICKSSAKKFLTFLIIFSGLLIYSFNLITTGLRAHETVTRCSPYKDWIDFVEYITIADVTFTMIVPFILISILNILIAFKLTKKRIFKSISQIKLAKDSTLIKKINFGEEKKIKIELNSNKNGTVKQNLKVRFTKSSTNDNNDTVKILPSSTCTFSCSKSKGNTNIITRKKQYSRTTKVVLSISTTFLILHSPIAICKLNSFLKYRRSNPLDAVTHVYNQSADGEILHHYFSGSSLNRSSYRNITIIANASYNNSETVIFDHLIERVSNNIYYLNFLINFFLYSLNGSKFRNALIRMFEVNLNFRNVKKI